MNHILSKAEYELYRAEFKIAANKQVLRAEDMILFNILSGRDPIKGFTPITNCRRLQSVAHRYGNTESAIRSMMYTIRYRRATQVNLDFSKFTDEQLAAILEVGRETLRTLEER